MKVFNLFVHLFAILAFLTLGSLLIIVSLHILTVEDAVFQLQALYASPAHSLRTGLLGLFFIMAGLVFTRLLIKKKRQSDALVYQSEIGPIVVSVTAIEDTVKKVIKRFHLVKDWRTKVLIQGKEVQIILRLVLWSGGRIQELLLEMQEQIRLRLSKMLGPSSRLEITCDVHRIEDHEPDLPEIERQEAVSV